ncbi:MAG TPA: membrane protein insertase YidC, partial [Pyrinomonadaceae bacterium]|nr:membrane protein insertase YidC [Pyrinomonadaceae bacterium]
MEQQNNQGQSRFLIAAVISMVVLFGWSYFFAPTKPATETNTTTAAANTTAAQPEQTPVPQQPVPQSTQTAATQDATPNRSITIKAPLYDVTIDSKGAVATSWILLKNKSPKGEYAIYADGSNKDEQKPLQLISQKALEQSPRELPFRLLTADQNITNLANERNYQISVPEDTIIL